MLTEAQKMEVENCIMSLSTTQQPELMMNFDSQINEQKDGSEANIRRPKMKLRDAREVLEIARLKVLVSEMREKGIKIEAQLLASSAADHGGIVHMKSHGDQKDNNNRELMKKQVTNYDEHIKHLHLQINALQCDVDKMLLELSGKDGLQKELTVAKAKIKGLQEEMRDDAGLTKAQLVLLKQQFGELQEIQAANSRKELEIHKTLQVSSELEAEVAELKQRNKELLHHKQESSKKLLDVEKRAEKMSSITEDDVVAAEAEVSDLRSANSDLRKVVEGLQISRFNEVEELVYLRWVNACLRHDLDTYKASHRNSEDMLDHSNKCSPTSHGNAEGNLTSYANANVYLTSHGNAYGNPTSHGNDKGNPTSHANAHGYPTSHGNDKGSSTIYHDSRGSPRIAISHDNNKGSPTSHHKPQQGMAMVESGSSNAAPHVKSDVFFSQSPTYRGYNDMYDVWQYGTGKLALQSSHQRISERQYMRTFSNLSAESEASSHMTTITSSPQKSSGKSFIRSSSNVSSSEASLSHMKSSPQKDIRRFMRSSSNLSTDSEVSTTSNNMNAKPLRRHSASSGMSLLDASSNMTTITSSPQKSSGKSFIRSSSNVSSSEASLSHMKSSPQKHIRSSSNLSTDSEVSTTSNNMNAKPLRRHSASSGVSLLDASSNMTTITSSPQKRSGKSFIRSSSNVSSSEASLSHMKSSPRKDIRSSSNLSTSSEVSTTSNNMNAKPLRRHSASSGMSLLDAYLQSTDTKGLNKPTSRFSSPFPHDRWSDSGGSPFGIIKEGVDFPKKHDPSNMRAKSFERQRDASGRVAASFQILSASTRANNTHPEFKDLPRQHSHVGEGATKAGEDMVERAQSSNEANADEKSSQNDVDDMPLREYPFSQVQSDTSSTQANFVRDLARSLQATDYRYIEDVTAFISWFDRQDDKQYFLNFSDWPENKVNAMRKAVYEYEELKTLESEISSFKDEPKSPTDLALKEMLALQEKAEKCIHDFLQARDLAIAQFKKFNIPTYWMLDSGMIGKIKLGSLQLAQKYMKRVTTDFDAIGDFQTQNVSRDPMLVQAARFLVQVHHFAGGFDENTLNAFKELQNKVDFHENIHPAIM